MNGKEIIDGSGKLIGKVVSAKFNCGIAMIEKELLYNSTNPIFKIDDEKVSIYDPDSLWESIKEITEENNKNYEEYEKEFNERNKNNKDI